MHLGWLIIPVQKRSVVAPFYFSLPSRVENRYDSLATPLGNKRVRPISSHMLSSMLFSMLNLSVLYFCDVFVAFFVYVWIIVVLFIVCLWIRVSRLSTHTHVHLHNISSISELRPFRGKCWLRSREIVISAMASQTLPEFMVLMTSWGCNLRTVIRKYSHSNRTLSIWNL